MSVVTNLILKVSLGDSVPVELINGYLISHGKGRLNKINQAAGGFKALECELWVGAFNNLNAEQFVEVFKKCASDYPEELQLFMQKQWDDKFQEVER